MTQRVNGRMIGYHFQITWVISLWDMKVSMTQSVMLAKRRKVMICLPGLATCCALVVHTRRAVSLITMPATKDQLLPNEMAFFYQE